MRAHHGVERDLLAVPEAVVLQPGRVPALAGVVVVADVGVGAGEHHLGRYYHKGKDMHGSAKATKIESSYLNEIPLQMSPKGMWGPENIKIKNFRWGLFEFYIFLY